MQPVRTKLQACLPLPAFKSVRFRRARKDQAESKIAQLTLQNDTRPKSSDLKQKKVQVLSPEKPTLEQMAGFYTYYDDLLKLAKDGAIKDEAVVIKIAEREARRGSISWYIDRFNISDQNARIALAKCEAERYPREFARNFEKFNIKDERVRIELAKMVQDKAGDLVAQRIEQWQISDQDALFDLASTISQKWPRNICVSIHNFHIESEEKRVELALFIATTDGIGIPREIANWNISNIDALFSIAMRAAAHSDEWVSFSIKAFGFTDPNQLVQIAKTASQHGTGIAFHIDDFGPMSRADLFEIAKNQARRQVARISSNIAKFYALTHDELFEIAKIAAVHNVFDLCEHIQGYKLDEDQLFTVALIAAKTNGEALSSNIKKFAINSEKKLYQLAKLAAFHPEFSRNIQNFGFTNLKYFEKLALIAAVHGPSCTINNLKYFQFTDESMYAQVVAECAKKDPKIVCESISSLAIKDEVKRIEIAKICAQLDGESLSKHIAKFSITDENARIEIAKLAAFIDGVSVANNIANYSISSNDALFQIAKIAVGQTGDARLCLIERFNFKDSQKRYLLALIAANQAGHTAFPYYQTVKSNPQAQLDLLVHCTPPDANVLALLCHNDLPQKLKKANESPQSLRSLEALQMFCSERWPECSFTLIEDIKNHKNEQIRQDLTTWIVTAITCFHIRNISSDKMQVILKQNLLKEITGYRNSAMRYKLSELVAHLASKESAWQLYEQFRNAPLDAVSHERLPLLYIATFASEGVDVEVLRAFRKIVQFRAFHDWKNLAILLKTLHIILHNSYLNKDDKQNLIQLITKNVSTESKRECNKNFLYSLQCILELNCSKLTKEALSVNSDLKAIMVEIFASQVPVGPVENLADAYVTQFVEKLRIPSALLVYAGRIRQLAQNERTKVLDAVGKYATAVMDGKFKELRYEVREDSHLQVLFKDRPELKKEWEKGDSFKHEDRLVVDTDDPYDLLLYASEDAYSCQSIAGDPEYNKCLPSVLLDGKIRILAVKDSSGKIVARRTIRLLYRADTLKPVLFVDRAYTCNKSDSHILFQMAQKRAKALGVPLAVEGSGGPILCSKNGPAPFEYVDAKQLLRICYDGSYQLTNTVLCSTE